LTAAQISDIYNNQSARFVSEGTFQLNNQSYLNITQGYKKVNISATIENNFGTNISLVVGYFNTS
jgi:hypothetical protein